MQSPLAAPGAEGDLNRVFYYLLRAEMRLGHMAIKPFKQTKLHSRLLEEHRAIAAKLELPKKVEERHDYLKLKALVFFSSSFITFPFFLILPTSSSSIPHPATPHALPSLISRFMECQTPARVAPHRDFSQHSSHPPKR